MPKKGEKWSIQSANALVHVATWVINHNSWYEHMLQLSRGAAPSICVVVEATGTQPVHYTGRKAGPAQVKGQIEVRPTAPRTLDHYSDAGVCVAGGSAVVRTPARCAGYFLLCFEESQWHMYYLGYGLPRVRTFDRLPQLPRTLCWGFTWRQYINMEGFEVHLLVSCVVGPLLVVFCSQDAHPTPESTAAFDFSFSKTHEAASVVFLACRCVHHVPSIYESDPATNLPR